MPVIKLAIFLDLFFVWHDNEIIISSAYKRLEKRDDRYIFDNVTVWTDTREDLKIIVQDEREKERQERGNR